MNGRFDVPTAACALLVLSLGLPHAGRAQGAPWAGWWQAPGEWSSVQAVASRGGGGVFAAFALGDPGGAVRSEILALSPEGAVDWELVLSSGEGEWPMDLAPLADGGLVLATLGPGPAGPFGTLRVHRVDADGRPVWVQALEVDVTHATARAVERPDGVVAVGLSFRPELDPTRRVLLATFAPDGTPGWQRSFSAGSLTLLSDLEAAPDGSLAMALSGLPAGGGVVLSLDAAGAVLWQAVYEGSLGAGLQPLWPLDLAIAADGLRVTAAYKGGRGQAFLMALEPLGEVAWLPRQLNAFFSRARGVVASDGTWTLLGGDDQSLDSAVPVLSVVSPDGASTLTRLLFAGLSDDVDLALPEEGGLVTGTSWEPEADRALVLTRHEADGTADLPCSWVADFDLTRSPPILVERLPVAVDERDEALSFVVDAPGLGGRAALLTCHSTAERSCWGVTATPVPPRASGVIQLSLDWDPDAPGLVVEWDLDGDGLADATGNPAEVMLPPGFHRIVALVIDPASAGSPCRSEAEVLVLPGLRAVSDVETGAPPLRVLSESRIAFEDLGAPAYALLVGTIGDWGPPAPGPPSRLRVEDAVPGRPGELEAALDWPAGSWVLVAAVDDGGRGPVGDDSLGRARDAAGDWP